MLSKNPKTYSSFPHFFPSFLLLSFHPKPNVFGHVRREKKAGRRRRKQGQFWGNMAHINLEILFYLIWTKLLLWTRCPRRAGTEPPQPRWARTGRRICHRDHGVLMNPWFFKSRSCHLCSTSDMPFCYCWTRCYTRGQCLQRICRFWRLFPSFPLSFAYLLPCTCVFKRQKKDRAEGKHVCWSLITNFNPIQLQ